MYPSLPNLIRVCTKPYTIPGTNVLIDKGTPVIIPIYAIHRDPLYYSDPDIFDPERFTEYNKEKRPAYTYLPFGEGPRICIGTCTLFTLTTVRKFPDQVQILHSTSNYIQRI
jgi:cytochrome P450 family 6